ncbi:hypothetical protein EDC18_10489 [Natranaerovirga pectinivora]|uniref:Uncharacterized protein n=1 Tax=Natranaerovirga pectinivora TaxID=682400 RepID=A0A4R3MKM5_9FIRM|nr:hypothetical protein [Natranaerovirga pectinivora]TCT14939.1 hypothetical protein EDC18_10489 [Natranaerovirga pectinivora]
MKKNEQYIGKSLQRSILSDTPNIKSKILEEVNNEQKIHRNKTINRWPMFKIPVYASLIVSVVILSVFYYPGMISKFNQRASTNSEESVVGNDKGSFMDGPIKPIDHHDLDITFTFGASIGSTKSSEILISVEELVNDSDLVVKAKIEKFNKVINAYDVSGTINFPVELYDLKINEVIKGTIDQEKVLLGFSISKRSDIEIGKEYIFLLKEVQGEEEYTYALVSLKQGVFLQQGDELTNGSGAKINYEDMLALAQKGNYNLR